MLRFEIWRNSSVFFCKILILTLWGVITNIVFLQTTYFFLIFSFLCTLFGTLLFFISCFWNPSCLAPKLGLMWYGSSGLPNSQAKRDWSPFYGMFGGGGCGGAGAGWGKGWGCLGCAGLTLVSNVNHYDIPRYMAAE